MKLLLVLFLNIFSSLAYAQLIDGQDRGNGGDLCEMRIIEIRNDLKVWISRGGSSRLQLPAGLSRSKYVSAMLEQISKARVRCMREIPAIGWIEKTCVNHMDVDGPMIECNYDRLMSAKYSAQYVLIHHEYAGLAGFEKNDGEYSDYSISYQVSSYLPPDSSLRLGDAPLNLCPVDKSLNNSQKMMKAIYKNDLSCVRFLAQAINLNEAIPAAQYQPAGWDESWRYVFLKMPPLAFAAALDKLDAITILLDAGAYIHVTWPLSGHYPVTVAAKAGNTNAIRLLVQRGAFINYSSREKFSPLDAALSNFENASYPLNQYDMVSLQKKVYGTIETLLDLGLDPNSLESGLTPLSIVADNRDLVDLMIRYGASPFTRDLQGRTAIFFCTSKECVDRFVALGNDVNASDFSNKRPIDVIDEESVVKALLSHGSRPRSSKSDNRR